MAIDRNIQAVTKTICVVKNNNVIKINPKYIKGKYNFFTLKENPAIIAGIKKAETILIAPHKV